MYMREAMYYTSKGLHSASAHNLTLGEELISDFNTLGFNHPIIEEQIFDNFFMGFKSPPPNRCQFQRPLMVGLR